MDYLAVGKRTARSIGMTVIILLLLIQNALGQADWRKEWEKTVEAGKREGRLSITTTRGPNWHAVFAEFRKDYPEIRVVSIAGSTQDLTMRILAERRAEKYLIDVVQGGPIQTYSFLYPAGALDPIKPALILPEVVDESKWFEGKHRYKDPERKYIFTYIGNAGSLTISYNSKLVDPKEFTSYRDFLNPKWKGKILALDPWERGHSAPLQFFYYNPRLGPEFIKELYGGMNMAFGRDFRQLVDWLARGKFALCFGCRDVQKAKNQGLPVDVFDKRGWREGAAFGAGGGSLNLVNRAPHPNAAKVFINWFLSRKGQMVYQELASPDNPDNSLRIDIPKDVVPMENRLFEGVPYMDLTHGYDMTPIFKLLNEAVKGR